MSRNVFPKPGENWRVKRPSEDGTRIFHVAAIRSSARTDKVCGSYLDDGKPLKIDQTAFINSHERVITSGTAQLLAPLGSVEAAIRGSK